jgi:hypothetical protein
MKRFQRAFGIRSAILIDDIDYTIVQIRIVSVLSLSTFCFVSLNIDNSLLQRLPDDTCCIAVSAITTPVLAGRTDTITIDAVSIILVSSLKHILGYPFIILLVSVYSSLRATVSAPFCVDKRRL